MPERNIVGFLLLSFFTLSSPQWLFAEDPAAGSIPEAAPWFASIQSSFVQPAKPKAKAASEQFFFFRWLSELTHYTYVPGLKPEELPDECRFKNYKMVKLANGESFSTRDYLRDCEDKITTGFTGVWGNIYRTLHIRYPMDQNPYLQRVVLELPGGLKQPALVGLKDDIYPRPWLVFRAGLFGNSVDLHAERFLVIQMFEQGSFNLLFLDSTSGPESIRLNSHQNLAGFEEGITNYQIAQKLRDPAEPIHRLVSDVYLMGISTGAHGVMMSMMLDALNKPAFTSAVALCPLLELQKTIEHHKHQNPYYEVMSFWAFLRLKPLREKFSGIWPFTAVADAFDIVKDQYKGLPKEGEGLKLPPGLDTSSYDSANNLFPHLSLIKKPVRIMASRMDALVPFGFNSAAIQEEKLSGKLPNFEVYPLNQSYHCTLPGPYAWDEISELILAQFVGLEESLKRDFVFHEEPLPEGVKGPISNDFNVVARPGDKDIVLLLGQSKIAIPIGKLGWGTSDSIRNEAEAELLIRWARHNIELAAGEEGRLVLRWRMPRPLLETAGL